MGNFKLCLISNWLCNLLPHNTPYQGTPASDDKASSEALILPRLEGMTCIPRSDNVTVFYSPLPSNEMLPHTHASHFAHNALVMGCF